MANFQVNVIGNQGSFLHDRCDDKFFIDNRKLYAKAWLDSYRTLIDVGRGDYDKVIEAIYKSESNTYRTTYRIQQIPPTPKKLNVAVLSNEEFQEVYPEYRVRQWWKFGFWIWRKNLKNVCFIQLGEEFETAYRRGIKNGLGKRKVGIERKYNKFIIIYEGDKTEAKKTLSNFLLGESDGKYLWK